MVVVDFLFGGGCHLVELSHSESGGERCASLPTRIGAASPFERVTDLDDKARSVLLSWARQLIFVPKVIRRTHYV